MATLEKIRSKAGLLVTIVIGLALLAFILTDFVKPGNGMMSKTRLEIGKVYGQSISVIDFQKKLAELEENYKKQSQTGTIDDATLNMIVDQTWNMMIEKMVMDREYKHLGINVTEEEFQDMSIGNNTHPQIRQYFTDPQTGQFSKELLLRFLKNKTGEQETAWLALEEQLIEQKKSEKYYAMLVKGLNITSFEAKVDSAENSKKSSFRYVMLGYNTIVDSSVKLSDSDYKEYFKIHKNEFKQEASRDIDFVVFPVSPSNMDYRQTEKYILSLKAEFEQTTGEDNARYVNLNSDTRFDEKFYKKEELPSDTLKNALWGKDENFVMGPIFENNAYRLFKLVQQKDLPDSVNARHILIKVEGNDQAAYLKAKALADSLKTLIEQNKSKNFAELAIQNSSDQGSAVKGGDLGWFKEGAMVKPFNDFCFKGKKGDIGIVESQFGIHIIEITDLGKLSPKVQLAILDKSVVPSNATRDSVYRKAQEFAGKSNTPELFDANTDAAGYLKRSAVNIKHNDKKIQEMNSVRDIISWVFEAELNQVSKVIDLDDKWIVAKITSVREDGIPEWKEVKEQLTPNVLKEKKAEMLKNDIKAKMANAKSIEDLAAAMNLSVESAPEVAFSAYAIPSGYEPKVIAAACALPEKALSEPISGNMGVFVLTVDKISESAEGNTAISKASLERMNSYALNSFMETMKKIAEVKDERYKFGY